MGNINTITTGKPLLTLTVTASESVSEYVFGNNDGTITGAELKPMGVFVTDAEAGEDVAIVTTGLYRVRTGGAFDVGTELEVDANGMAVEASAGIVVADAREEAYGVTGESVLCELRK
jgi:hypothetical protein